MIDGLKPYPAYKHAREEWLGEVPEHWGELPLKRIAGFDNSGSYGDEPEKGDLILPVATTAQINRDGYFAVKKMPRRGFSNDEAHRYGCKPGDILVVKSSGSIFNVISGKAGFVDAETPKFVFSNFLMRVLPCKDVILPRFLFLLLSTHLTRERIKRMVSGTTYPNLRVDEYIAALLPLPPLPEQSAIVRFLDYVDRRIRRDIRAKKKLIELLNEQKQAIIHHAVTSGLNPNARLKPSGVEGLEDVPEHWEVRPAKHFYREVDERSATGAEELLSVSHITGVTPRSQKNITMFMAMSYIGHKLCRPGDLVINTMWAWMAALGVAKQTGIVSPSYGVYRPLQASKLLSQYADLLLRTKPYVSEYICRSTGIRSSRLRLYPEQFLRIRLVFPSAEEQKAILERVTVETAASDRAITSAHREIDLLHEYRTRLIADVVTGKLDVREAAAGLPQEEAGGKDETTEDGEMDAAGPDESEGDAQDDEQ
jgi:type I restriction enzyme, S subunit